MEMKNGPLVVHPSLRKAYFFAALYLVACVQGFYRLQAVGFGDNLPIISIGLLVVLLAFAHLKRFLTVYTLTSDYIECRQGLFARSGIRAPLDRVTGFAARQTAMQRMLLIADVGIKTPGIAAEEFLIANLTKHDAQRVIQHITEFQSIRIAAANA